MAKNTDEQDDKESAAQEAFVRGERPDAGLVGEREAEDERAIVNAIEGVMSLRDLLFVLGRLETRFGTIRNSESRRKPTVHHRSIRQAEDIVRALGRALGTDDEEGLAKLHEPTLAILGPHEAPSED